MVADLVPAETLTEGIGSGEIRIDSPSLGMLARCVLDVLWIPEDILLTAAMWVR
jgi:hypothetical protein